MKWWAIYINLPVDPIVRLLHPRSADSQGQETFLSASADKQTCNYDIEWSTHNLYLSPNKIYKYIQIYQWMPSSDNLILPAEIARARKRF